MTTEFLLGDIRIRPAQLAIERDGRTITVEPKVMDVLVHLAERPDETVSRQALKAAVWPDVHVSEDALNRCIWKLRRALEDERTTPRYLATVPKRGYRLVVPITWPGATPAVPAQSRVSSRAIGVAMAVAIVATVGVVATVTRLGSGAGTDPGLIAPTDRVEPFTSLEGYESAPAISPDGRTVAFQHYVHAGPRAGQSDLMVKAVDGNTAPTALTDTKANELFPVWSPDGTRLAFRRQDAARCDIIVMDLEARTETLVAPCDTRFWSRVAWESDGATLILAERPGAAESSRLVRVALADGSRIALTDPPVPGGGDTDPVVSPDGGTLAFARARNGDHRDVFVMPVAGGSPRRVTFDDGRLGGFHWAADGHRIVYASDRLGPYRLWTVPVAGGPPTALITVGHNATSPAIGPAGPKLVYEEWKSTIDVRLAPLHEAGGARAEAFEATPLVSSTRWDTQARWSPDGRQLAFLSDRLGSTDVWLADGDGTSPTRVWSAAARFDSWLRWSPDGTRVAFGAPVGDQFDIHVLNVRTGELARLEALASDDRWPAWASDGRAIYFGSNRSGRWEIWRHSWADGQARPVTSDGGAVPMVTGDGAALLFVKDTAPGLWRLDLSTPGPPVRVVDAIDAGQPSWDVRGHVVFVATTPPGQPPSLVAFDLTAGASRVATLLESPAGGYPEWFPAGISVSPDGRHVAFSSIERSESDLWIVR